MNSLLKSSHKLDNRKTAPDKISFLINFLYRNPFNSNSTFAYEFIIEIWS